MGEFKKRSWSGWIESSRGYSVRILGRNRLQYLDELGELNMFVEPMANYTDIVLDPHSIPDHPLLSRLELVGRLERAFEFAGWTLILTDTSGGKE